MPNPLKEAFAELEHVVWPTHLETKNFFQVVVAVIAGMTIFTYLLTLAFSNSLFGLREMIHTTKSANLSNSPTVTAQPLELTTESGQKLQVTPVATEPTKK